LPTTVSPRALYEARAKSLVKELREEKHVSYEQLSKNLVAYGVKMETQALINRINRGRFTFTFALQVLAALGVKSIQVPQLGQAKPPVKPVN
jgi:hypothetical protein